ncbi:MAG: phosphohydrolase [Chloroflexota bacterium]
MTLKCPGQDGRDLKVDVMRCPGCGAEVEIFSDEFRVRCQKCKKWVCRKEVPSCYQWCRSARECLGEAKWQELKAQGLVKSA